MTEVSVSPDSGDQSIARAPVKFGSQLESSYLTQFYTSQCWAIRRVSLDRLGRLRLIERYISNFFQQNFLEIKQLVFTVHDFEAQSFIMKVWNFKLHNLCELQINCDTLFKISEL